MRILNLTAFLSVLLTPFLSSAQNATVSPYSMFGLGDMETGSAGMYVGMGNVSLALRNKSYINGSNPASLTSLSENTFLFGAGLYGEYRQLTQTGTSESSVLGNLKNLTFGFRLCRSLYASAGIIPLTSVGYALKTTEPMEGSGSLATTYYEGDGGLNKVYIGTAWQISKNLSAGINWGYVYGTIRQAEVQNGSSVQKESFTHMFYPDFGIQYVQPVDKDQSFTLALTYGYRQKMRLDNTLTVTTSSEAQITEQPGSWQYLPQYMGVGASWSTDKVLLALDYYKRDYGQMRKDAHEITFTNQHQLNVGLDFMTEKRTQITHWLLGASVANTYMMVKEKKGYQFSVSAGMAIPTKTIGMLGVGLKYERQFYKHKTGINENRISLNFNVQLGELSLIRKLQ